MAKTKPKTKPKTTHKPKKDGRSQRIGLGSNQLSKVIFVRVDAKTHAGLTAAADKSGMGIALFVRHLLDESSAWGRKAMAKKKRMRAKKAAATVDAAVTK